MNLLVSNTCRYIIAGNYERVNNNKINSDVKRASHTFMKKEVKHH